MRTTVFAISVILLAAPPAAAQTAKSGAATAKATAGQERKYCIQYEAISGSRTADRKECKTKAEWARQGIDVDQPAED